MQKTKDAVRYAIETLGITPEKFFHILESSQGYEGDDYSRWLAGKVIEIANDDGVGYSKLLVKRFDIIQSIISNDGCMNFSSKFLDFVQDRVGSETLLVGMNTKEADVPFMNAPDEDDTASESDDTHEDDSNSIDWYGKVDTGYGNYDFYDSLPDSIKESDKLSMFCVLSEESSKKGMLLANSKSRGISCKSLGSLMMYRACMLADTYDDLGKDFKFSFLCRTEFLCDSENQGIIDYFLKYFNYTGFTVDSNYIFEDSLNRGRYAFIECMPIKNNGKMQDGFVLADKDGGKLLRYSKSNTDMFECLYSKYHKLCVDDVPADTRCRGEDLVKGLSSAYGYLYNKNGKLLVLSNPITTNPDVYVPDDLKSAFGGRYVPITNDNIFSIIAYYGLSESVEGYGMFSGITDLVTGSDKYNEVVFNCVPLFLYGTSSRFFGYKCKDTGTVFKNYFRYGSKLSKKLLEMGEVYFSFEAKELCSVCEDIVSEAEKEGINFDAHTMTVNSLRLQISNKDLNNRYLSALTALKDYVSSLYRKM